MNQQPAAFTNNKGQKLFGVFHIPDGKGSFPCVIYLHGYQSNKESNKILGCIESLSQFAAFRYDAAGHGESEGNFAETTVSQWVDDMRTAIEFVKSQPFVDKKKIGLYGSSLGGMAVLLAATGRADLKGITPICPVSDFSKTSRTKKLTEHGLEEWKKLGFSYTYSTKLGKMVKINYSFHVDGISHNVYKAAEKIQCPVMVIHGTADPTVPFEQSVELQKHNHLIKIHPIAGAEHDFVEEDHYCEFVDQVSRFFKKLFK